MLLLGPQPLFLRMNMLVLDNDEERLARVERMLAQWRRQNAARTAIAASKVVGIVVDATPSIDASSCSRPGPELTMRINRRPPNSG
jgi:hypothetical protein